MLQERTKINNSIFSKCLLNHINKEITLVKQAKTVPLRPVMAAASAAKTLLKHCTEPIQYIEAIRYLEILGIFGTLSPIVKPSKGDYKKVKAVDSCGIPYTLCVHSRHPYLFSSNNGKTWYIYDSRKQTRKFIKFPFSPKI